MKKIVLLLIIVFSIFNICQANSIEYDKTSLWSKAYEYEKNNDYKNAYIYHLESAKQNDTMSMMALAKIVEKNPNLSTIKNEVEYWYLKVINTQKDNDLAISFLERYYRDTNQKEKRKLFMKDMYKKYNALNMGCGLASDLYFDKKYVEAFDLAKEIYENNSKLPLFNSCISTLSYLYGDEKSGIGKNINKAIQIQIEYFNQEKEDDLTAKNIAETFLKEKKDYENAEKWYKIAYDLKKDEKYLTEVENYRKSQPIYSTEKETEQALFPIINNPIISKNIIASTGAYKDHYDFFATSNRDIIITDDYYNVIQTLNGWIGNDYSEGITNAMTYDETNKLLYVTGINSKNDFNKNDIVKIFNITTGKIVKTLNNNNSFIPINISISKDGKYLLAVNNGGSNINIINTNNNDILNFKTIKENYIHGVIKKEEDDYSIYVLDKENFINKFSIKKERLIDRKKFQGKVYFFEDRILENKRNNVSEIFDYKYNLLQTIMRNKEMNFKSILLSADESKIIFSTNEKIEIYDLKKEKVIQTFNFKDEILDAYLDVFNNLYYTTKNNLYSINLINNEKHAYYKEENINSNKIIELKIDEKVLDIGFENNKKISFDLDKVSLVKNNLVNNTVLQKKDEKITFSIIDKKLIEIYEKDKLISEINLFIDEIKNVEILNNKYVWVDVGYSYLIFNMKGQMICQVNNLQSRQKLFFTNNNLLYTSGDDNVIHLWDLNKLDSIKINDEIFDQQMLKSFHEIYKVNPLEFFSEVNINIIKAEIKNVKWNKKPTLEQYRKSMKTFLLKKEVIKPLASLYIKNEKDWIIYTPEGLFTYGGNGKDLLKYHQNQGLYKEAKIVENDRLFEKFYRPDLIKKILAGEKVEIPMDVKSVILNILPPELKILASKMINDKDIDLTYQVCDAGNGIADPKLIINGQAINPPTSRGFNIEKIEQNDKCNIYRSVHTLDRGNNEITFKAYDKDKNISNNSEKLNVTANYTTQNKSLTNVKLEEEIVGKDKSNLYFLSIAVSDYEDNGLDLKYSVKDVNAVKEKFITKSKKTFENIYSFNLDDKNVSKDSIEKTFDEISKKIKYNDTFVLYIAGHGMTRDGKYQFLPYSLNEKISIDDLKHNLSKIYTNKSLVLLDTCQSGAAIENIDNEATKNRLAYDSSKVNYIVASSSNQVALEGYNDHGVFTYSVLEAFDNNEKLKVWELANDVSQIVPKITKEKYKYEQIPQTKLNRNFILKGEN